MPDALPLACCVDAPAGADALVRYGLDELLRGLGLHPAWTRREDARLVVSADATRPSDRALRLSLTAQAVDALIRPRRADPDHLGWVEIEGERWPLPVGPAGNRPDRDADVVASAAWWLAGLQERATTERDRHGRFPYAASLQAALGEDAPGSPLRPAVDAYRQWLAASLRACGADVPGRMWGGAPWAMALTHDLDAVRTRRLAGAVGEVLRGRPGHAARRAVGLDDRWQSALALRALAKRHGVRATWFLKPAAWTPEDVPYRLDGRLRSFLTDMEADGHEVGWHPGYGAHDHPARLVTERERFTAALGHPPALARTHFLRWTEPTTPRLLRESGVEIDSTLGFSAHEGFRRGTAHPFRLFDADAGRVTDLWEMPLAVMDTTLAQHRGLTDDGIHEALGRVLTSVRRVGGCAVILWHNDMGEGRPWDRRLHVLDHSIRQALADGAAVGPLGRLLRSWRGAVGEEADERGESPWPARHSQ